MKSLYAHLLHPLQSQFNLKSSLNFNQETQNQINHKVRIQSKLNRMQQILQSLQNQMAGEQSRPLNQNVQKIKKLNLSSTKLQRPIIAPLNLGSLQGSKFNSLTKQGHEHFIKKGPVPSQADKYTMSMTEEEPSGFSQSQYNHKKYLFSQSQSDLDYENNIKPNKIVAKGIK